MCFSLFIKERIGCWRHICCHLRTYGCDQTISVQCGNIYYWCRKYILSTGKTYCWFLQDKLNIWVLYTCGDRVIQMLKPFDKFVSKLTADNKWNIFRITSNTKWKDLCFKAKSGSNSKKNFSYSSLVWPSQLLQRTSFIRGWVWFFPKLFT